MGVDVLLLYRIERRIVDMVDSGKETIVWKEWLW